MSELAVAILAAGQSRRFGSADKLLAGFRGKPLGHHVSDTLADLSEHFAHRWVVVSSRQHPCVPHWETTGWSLLVNDRAEQGMGTSLAMSAKSALQAEAKALLICLADMPLVPKAHFQTLCERMESKPDHGILVSCNRNRRMPPALFGAAHFTELAIASKDIGARELLVQGECVECHSELLSDIDDAETLQRLN